MFKFQWNTLDFAHKFDQVPQVISDKEFEKHYHNFYEIFFFVSGTATYTVENEKRSMQTGDALIIKPGKFHNVEFCDDSPYERYVLKLPISFVPPFLEQRLKNHSAFFPHRQQAAELFSRLDMMYEIYSGDELYYMFGCIATEIIIYLCHFDDTTVAENEANRKIVPILQYINNNITKPIKLEDLSEQFHYSQSYISHEFFEYMKTPIMKYIRTKRMLAAQRLVLQGVKPTKVAESLGFSDYSTFYRSYVAVIGQPPSTREEDNGHTFFDEFTD